MPSVVQRPAYSRSGGLLQLARVNICLHGTRECALFLARAHIGMYAPCVRGITGQSTALMPLLV